MCGEEGKMWWRMDSVLGEGRGDYGFLQSKNILDRPTPNTDLAKVKDIYQYIDHTRGAMGYPTLLNYGQSVDLTPVKFYPQGLNMVLKRDQVRLEMDPKRAKNRLRTNLDHNTCLLPIYGQNQPNSILPDLRKK